MNKFLLHKEFNVPLDKNDFIKAKKKYLESIRNNEYTLLKTNDILEMIQNIKRSPEKIGPYQNISIFEALNRIGSDLVLVSGAELLFNGALKDIKVKTIKLNMGNTHGFDFIIETNDSKTIYGEAFNAAESFCKEKMRQAINKLIDNKENKSGVGVVFVNEDVKEI